MSDHNRTSGTNLLTSSAMTRFDRLPALVKVVVVAVTIFGLGWSGHVIFSEQVGMPAVVGRTQFRVDTLEMRMVRAEEVLTEIAINTLRLASLTSSVDSLDAMLSDTYCLVRAHALNLDPLVECTYAQRRPRATGRQ